MLYFLIISLPVLHPGESEAEDRFVCSRGTVVRWLCSPQTTGISAPVNVHLRLNITAFVCACDYSLLLYCLSFIFVPAIRAACICLCCVAFMWPLEVERFTPSTSNRQLQARKQQVRKDGPSKKRDASAGSTHGQVVGKIVRRYTLHKGDGRAVERLFSLVAVQYRVRGSRGMRLIDGTHRLCRGICELLFGTFHGVRFVRVLYRLCRAEVLLRVEK